MSLLLIAFAATGTALFSVLGITLPAFRTAGGLILWFVALDMLHGERRTQEGRDEVVEGTAKEDVALTPLAIPMLAGPGAISTVIVISGQARGAGQTAVVYLAIILTGVGVIHRAAHRRAAAPAHREDRHPGVDAHHGPPPRRARRAVRAERGQGGVSALASPRSSGKSSSQNSSSTRMSSLRRPASSARRSTRRILPEIVFGSSANSMHRIRL